jgi:hypothetical protein
VCGGFSHGAKPCRRGVLSGRSAAGRSSLPLFGEALPSGREVKASEPMRHAELRQSVSHAGRSQQTIRAIGSGAVSEPAWRLVALSSERVVGCRGRERDASSCLQEVAGGFWRGDHCFGGGGCSARDRFLWCASAGCTRRSASQRSGSFGSRGAAAYVDGVVAFGRRRAPRCDDPEVSVLGGARQGVRQLLSQVLQAFAR